MARFRKNESIAAKRRVKIYVYQDDNITPAPTTETFAAVAAHVALTGTHHATLTWNATGLGGNAITIELVADGSGTGSLTHVGSVYKFHYQTGVTTMANFVTAAAGVFTFSGHTPADVLASTGDTQGPLALAGGVDFGFEVSQGSPTYQAAVGTWSFCTRNFGTAIIGCIQYEFTQPELNFLGSEVQLKLEYPGYKTEIYSFDMNDAADFDSIAEGAWTHGDFSRLAASILGGKVQNFGSGTLAFRNLSDTKVMLTSVTATIGRIAVIVGSDLS